MWTQFWYAPCFRAATRYTRAVARVLESGKLQLTAEEAVTYRAAAERLHEACEITLDLGQPIASDDWILILAAHAALQGDVAVVDDVIATLRTAIQGRKQTV